ncbi:hypothetical protein GCM10017776_18370 [Streptomyces griseoluteus]|nr:hypothetical protein GCM10017776_18370 [Streptomyces griseoluteus]
MPPRRWEWHAGSRKGLYASGPLRQAAAQAGQALDLGVDGRQPVGDRFDVAPDGRLFRNQAGNHVDAAAYGITWARDREYALTRTERASRLTKRPYDLRHAGISFWLHSGVDPVHERVPARQSR